MRRARTQRPAGVGRTRLNLPGNMSSVEALGKRPWSASARWRETNEAKVLIAADSVGSAHFLHSFTAEIGLIQRSKTGSWAEILETSFTP